MRDVSVSRWTPSIEIGGCNGCTRDEQVAGEVVEVRLRSATVRLCRGCLRALLPELNERRRQP